MRHRVPGLTGIDTRRLTRHLRDHGSMPAAFGPLASPAADGGVDEATLKAAALAEPGTDGVDLVATVTTAEPYTVGDGPLRVVAYDFGIKRTILRHLSGIATVEVVPATTPADEVLARRPDGVFLSNGPGDPAAVAGTADAIAGLLGEVPVFGICLGHQLLATALGGRDLQAALRPPRRQPPGAAAGHRRGGDHQPEPQLRGGRRHASPAADVTHVNLNDGVIEGIRCRDVAAFGVQYHPEAGPGPARRPLPLRRVPPADGAGGGALMPRRDDLETILVIGSGPIVIGQAVRVRLLRHPGLPGPPGGGLPGRAGQLQPGHDHDRPRLRRSHLHRAAHARGPGRHRRARAARRGAADARRPDRPSTWPWPCTTGASSNASASR